MMEAAYTCHQSLARGEFCCFMIGKCLWGKIKGQFCLRVGESQIGINTAQHNTRESESERNGGEEDEGRSGEERNDRHVDEEAPYDLHRSYKAPFHP